MKITLILAAAPDDPLKKNDPFMPLSLPLLAAAAPAHEYCFVDMLAGETPDVDRPADLVGISARITAEKVAFEISDAFRERGVTVVLGGAQISSNAHAAAEHADAVVVGEGEGVWPLLLDDAARGTLKTFYLGSPAPFDTGGLSVHRSDGFLDLSSISHAIASRKIYKRKYVFDTVFASRGCAVGCDFCSVGALFGRRTRLRPVSEVVREIASFKRFYYLLDDTVFGRPATYAYYSGLYDAVGSLDKVNYWTGQANLDAASTPEGREVIRKAANAGLIYASVGMESINPAVMRKAGTLGKNGTTDPERVVDQMRRGIRFIQDQGVAVSGWFTIGYEEDNVETFYKTLEFCNENQVIPVLCPLEALPGTRLHERLGAEGRVDAGKRINVRHPEMTDDDILGALADCAKRGFSLREIFKRTRFYSKRFAGVDHDNNAGRRGLIEKVIFVFVLQVKMKKGIIGLANTGAVS
jgi:radical SAM superfamily enzyme YgiQ (UPF0313 family)